MHKINMRKYALNKTLLCQNFRVPEVKLMISPGSRGPSVRSRFYEVMSDSKDMACSTQYYHRKISISLMFPPRRKVYLAGPVPNYAIAKWWCHTYCILFKSARQANKPYIQPLSSSVSLWLSIWQVQ